MTDLVKVYSPEGEMFENSPANARDLVTHVGWSYEKPASEVFTNSAPAPIVEEIVVVQEKVSEDVLADQAEEEIKENEQEFSEGEETEEVKASTRGRKKKA